MSNDPFSLFDADDGIATGSALDSKAPHWIVGKGTALWVPTPERDTPSVRTALLVSQNDTGGLLIGQVQASPEAFDALPKTAQTVDALRADQPLANPAGQSDAQRALLRSVRLGLHDVINTVTLKGRFIQDDDLNDVADNPFSERKKFRPYALDIMPNRIQDAKDQIQGAMAKKPASHLERTGNVVVGDNTHRVWKTPEGDVFHKPLLSAVDRANARLLLAHTLGTEAIQEANQVFAAGRTPLDGIAGTNRFGALDPKEGARWDAAAGLTVARMDPFLRQTEPSGVLGSGVTAQAHSLASTFTKWVPVSSPFGAREERGKNIEPEHIYTPDMDVVVMGGFSQARNVRVALGAGDLAPDVLDAHAHMAWEHSTIPRKDYSAYRERTEAGVTKGLERLGGTPRDGWAYQTAWGIDHENLTLKGVDTHALARFAHRTELEREEAPQLPKTPLSLALGDVAKAAKEGRLPSRDQFEAVGAAAVQAFKDNFHSKSSDYTPQEPPKAPVLTRAGVLAAAAIGQAQEDGLVPPLESVRPSDLHKMGVRVAFVSTAPAKDPTLTPIDRFVAQAPDLVAAWGGDRSALPSPESLRKGMVDRLLQEPDLDRRVVRHQALAKAMAVGEDGEVDTTARNRQKALFAQALGVQPSQALQAVLPPTREEKRTWAIDKAKAYAQQTSPAPAQEARPATQARKRVDHDHNAR